MKVYNTEVQFIECNCHCQLGPVVGAGLCDTVQHCVLEMSGDFSI